ncbi:MAG: hypothetical protein J3K34DRAFT_521611 [Monoraphidium minutum]|nr:MAG: hypothetical protein J3K34DRAFT_521611 [Monoraphidium minutum]
MRVDHDYREANAAAAAASSSGGGDGDDGAHTQRPLNPEQRRRALGSVLREAQLAEAGMSKFFAAQQLLLRGRPDAAYFAEQERRQLDAVQELMPRYRTRPSLLLTLAQAAGAGAGALAAAAPRRLWDAVVGGLQDALTEVYNEQLGELRRQGLSDDEPEVRRLVLALRDMERAPEGAPAPPDVLALQRAEALRGVGVAGVAGAVAKAAALVLLGAGKRL